MSAVTATPARGDISSFRAALPQLAPFLGIFAVAMIMPFVSNDYWALIGTRAAIYWVLVSGLNLIVGFAGHLAIGYVALLTLGAYVTSVLVAGNVMPALPVFAALPIAAAVGAVFGVIVGCGPSISRCRRSASPPSSPRSHWPGRASPAVASAYQVPNFRRPSIPPGATIISASALRPFAPG
jgi:hypothetical protein